MNIEAEELINLLEQAELMGAWKALNWIAREWDENMTLDDISECIQLGTIALEERLAEEFKDQHYITSSMKRIVERRMKEKVKVKAT